MCHIKYKDYSDTCVYVLFLCSIYSGLRNYAFSLYCTLFYIDLSGDKVRFKNLL